jgi:glycosyltransferase involved in cell wall biosynthesis
MLSNLYPPIVSGSSIQSCTLAREFVKRGKEVVVITAHVLPSSEAYEVQDGVHVYRIPCIKLPKMEIALNFPWLNTTLLPGNMKRIVDIIIKHKIDILHLHNHMFDLALSAVKVRKKLCIPMVVTIHTMIKHAQDIYNFLLYPADRIFLKNAVIKNSDIVISPDYNILDYVKTAFGGDNNRLILYGIDKVKRPEQARIDTLIDRFNLAGKRIILSVGHVHKIRDRKDLVESMPIVLEQIPNAILLIVGSVATAIPLKIARRLGIEDKVIFSGPLPHDDVAALLSIADMEAHWLNQDSPDKTSLGIASLESMGSGKVTIAVANENTYGYGVLKNGENVILVEAGKPEKLARIIISIFLDGDRCDKIGRRARRTIEEHFNWDKVCNDTLVVYKKALLQSPWNQA